MGATATYSKCLFMDKKIISCNLPVHKKNRSHFEIIALILKALTEKSASPYSIMRESNVNYRQLKKYLRFLADAGFIEIDAEEKQVLYRSGEKGFDFLRYYYILEEMLLSGPHNDLKTGGSAHLNTAYQIYNSS